jgi:SSS family solute:Na+ symporter
MTLTVVGIYMLLVLMVGGLSHRLFRGTGEDYFLATRSIGPFVLLMSLFGTNMTAFALLGGAGEAYRSGIGVFTLMPSAAALVIPTTFFFVGTRLWALGKRHGYITQVQYFRDRYGSNGLGLLLFIVLVALVVPYLVIGIMGGGLTLTWITNGQVPEWVGGLVICTVVLIYVTYGGLRGTAWANTFQTLVFMILGAATFIYVINAMGGLGSAISQLQVQYADLLVRGDHFSPIRILTYTLIPLSAGMFPHMFMHWLTASKLSNFRITLVAYPICIAIVWVPSVLMGVVGNLTFPDLSVPASNSILVRLISHYSPELLAGLLGAGVFAAVMSSLDSQVLSLGTMFTQDIVRHYGYDNRMSGKQQILIARVFVAGILVVAYLMSLVASNTIFALGTWCFTGFSALFPIVLAGLFWKRSTKAGVYASILTVVVLWVYFFAQGWGNADYTVGGTGVMAVAVITPASALALILVSLMTKPPEAARLAKFFADSGA